MRNFIRHHWRGIKNLWEYRKIVYEMRDFDYSYDLKLLEFKLTRTADYIEKHKRFVNYEFVVRDIRLCVKLLRLYLEQDYSVEYLQYYSSTISFEPLPDRDDLSIMVESDIVHNFDVYFSKYPLIYRQVLRGEGVIFHGLDDKSLAMNVAHINQERVKRLFFKLFEERVERWWD